jgi:hypothetical protein
VKAGAAAVAALVLLAVGVAAAQVPGPGAGPLPASVPAPPDTAVARFAWAEEGPRPVAIAVAPTAVKLGQLVTVMIDLPAGTEAPPVATLAVDVDWLEPAPDAAPAAPAGLAPAAGPRLLAPFRVYRLGPWRAAWGEAQPGRVLLVNGALEPGAGFVPVRDPRRLGGLPFWALLAAVAVLAVTLALFLWWRWRGRPAAIEAADRPLPPPAWLQAAVELWGLEDARGHDRSYLDGLAGVLRRYLHGRFHLPAEEMTASEIAAAAGRTGWPEARLGAFATILAGCDQARYAPAGVSAQQCRDGMRRLLDLIEAERVDPVWTPVPAERRAAAAAAWQRLRERYPAGSDGGSSC